MLNAGLHKLFYARSLESVRTRSRLVWICGYYILFTFDVINTDIFTSGFVGKLIFISSTATIEKTPAGTILVGPWYSVLMIAWTWDSGFLLTSGGNSRDWVIQVERLCFKPFFVIFIWNSHFCKLLAKLILICWVKWLTIYVPLGEQRLFCQEHSPWHQDFPWLTPFIASQGQYRQLSALCPPQVTFPGEKWEGQTWSYYPKSSIWTGKKMSVSEQIKFVIKSYHHDLTWTWTFYL